MAITAAQLQAVVQVTGADTAKSQLSDVGKSADNVSGGFGNMLKQGLANAAGFAVFNVGAKAVGFLKDQFADTLQVAMQHQQIMSQTAQVIKSTGDASGMTAQSISDLAMSLSKVTPFSDDVIQSGENILLTFTGIGKDVFPQTTKTMLDMAQAMGMDTKSAAMQLGKALNDPAQGLSALSREGVTFSEKQKEMIKHMVAVGNTAGAQKIMLAELQKEFGGSAQAAGKTFGGQLQILQNNLEDVKQKIGMALLPILGQFTGWISTSAMPLVNQFSDWFSNVGAPAISNFGNFISQNIVPAFQKFGGSAKGLNPILKDLGAIAANLASDVGPFIQRIADWSEKHKILEKTTNIVKVALNDAKEVIKSVEEAITPIIHNIKDWTDKHDPLKIAVNAVKTALTDGKKAIDDTKNAIKDVISWYQQWKPWIDGVAIAITTFFLPAMIKAGTEAVVNGVKITTSFIQSMIQSGTEAVVNGTKVTIQFVQSMIKAGIEAVINGAKITGEFVSSIIKTGIEGWNAAGKLALFIGNIIKSGIESAIAGGKVAVEFVGNIIKTGVEAAIAGGKVVGSFISSIVLTGTQAVVNGAKVVGSFIASMITAGAQAIVSGAQIVASFVAGLITAGAEAIVSAGIFLATLVPSLLAVAAATIAATWPYLLIAAVVAAVVAGIVLAIQHWAQITAWFQGVWTVTWNAVSAFFTNIWNGVISFLKSAWDVIVNIAKTAAQILLAVIIGPIGLLFILIMQHWTQIQQWLSNAWNNLRSLASNAFSSVVSTIAGFLGGLGSKALTWAQDMINQFVQGILSGVGAVGNAVSKIADKISSFLHFSKPDVGPLVNVDNWMPDFGDLLSKGLANQVSKVQAPALQLASTMAMSISPLQGGLTALPAGARAIPSSIVSQSSASRSGEIHVHNYIDGKEITNNVGPRIIKTTRTSGPIRSNV